MFDEERRSYWITAMIAAVALSALPAALTPSSSVAQSTGVSSMDETPQEALRRLAKEAEARGETSAAQRYWTKLAHDGDADAMWRLAAPIAEQGVAEPGAVRTRAEMAVREEAFFWLRKSALAGNIEAQRLVAAAYLAGDGVAANAAAAAVWYRRSATAGDPMSQHNYALLLDQGRGVPRDSAEAELWFERAAAQDYAPALQRLGRLSETAEAAPATRVEAVVPDRATEDSFAFEENAEREAEAGETIDIFELLTEQPVETLRGDELTPDDIAMTEERVATLTPTEEPAAASREDPAGSSIERASSERAPAELAPAAPPAAAPSEPASSLETLPIVETLEPPALEAKAADPSLRTDDGDQSGSEAPKLALSPAPETVDVEASAETTTEPTAVSPEPPVAAPRSYEITILPPTSEATEPLLDETAQFDDDAAPSQSSWTQTDDQSGEAQNAEDVNAADPSALGAEAAALAPSPQIAAPQAPSPQASSPLATPQQRTAAPIASPRPVLRAAVTTRARQQLALPIDADLLLQGAATAALATTPEPPTPQSAPAAFPPIPPAPLSIQPPSLQDAIATGDALALRELARRHQLGDGVPRDRAIAFALWRAAARLGDSSSATAVANIGAVLTREEIARSEEFLESLYDAPAQDPVLFPDGMETRDPLVADPPRNPR